MGSLLMAVIRLYQVCLSPLLGNNCRFTPSCSQYAIDAIRIHGAIKGVCYAVWRLVRCQPLCKGGHDPVPQRAGAGTHAWRT
jgi:hypothetical protein